MLTYLVSFAIIFDQSIISSSFFCILNCILGNEDCSFDEETKLHWPCPRTYATAALANQYTANPTLIHPHYTTNNHHYNNTGDVSDHENYQARPLTTDQMQSYVSYNTPNDSQVSYYTHIIKNNFNIIFPFKSIISNGL